MVWGATNLTGGDRTFPTVLGLAFLAVSVAPLLLFRRARQRAREAMRLLNEGSPAIGTVTDVQDTGVTVNRNPQVRMSIRIEPTDGSPGFDGEKTSVVSRVNLPRPGQRYPVWYDPADRTNFVVVTKVDDATPAPVRELFEEATATGGDEARAADDPDDRLDRLGKLNELRLAGALTDEEFAAEKARLLHSD